MRVFSPDTVSCTCCVFLGRPLMRTASSSPQFSTVRECFDGQCLSLCRYGYSTVQQLERVVQSYAYFKIPLETFVTDSQYMDHDQDFTISPDFENFGVSF